MLFCAGGSAGIGECSALAFNKDGATVVIIGRTLEKLEATRARMAYPNKCIPVTGDISTNEGVKAAIGQAVRRSTRCYYYGYDR